MKNIVNALSQSRIWRKLPDSVFLRVFYYYHFKKMPNLKHPVLYNEKLQWLKLHDRKPQYTEMVDKYQAKKYIERVIGPGHTIPTLGVWANANDIDITELPDQFVLKCNHDSHSIEICRDKKTFDFEGAKHRLQKRIKKNGFWYGREWPYKNVKPLIIAEPFMYDENQTDCLYDYKYFCFDGIPRIMYISNDNSVEAHTDFFDMDFNPLPIRMKDPNSTVPPNKPVQFEEMKEYATKLSKGIKHLRVDFYIINRQVYVGELTFYHNSGVGKITPEEWNYKLGSWINL